MDQENKRKRKLTAKATESNKKHKSDADDTSTAKKSAKSATKKKALKTTLDGEEGTERQFNASEGNKKKPDEPKDIVTKDISNNSNEIKPDPATSLVPVKSGDVISLFGEGKKPWFGIVHEVATDQKRMKVTFLEPEPGRRVQFKRGETVDVPHDSLICTVTFETADQYIVIREAEQKRAHNVQQKIDQHIENPTLENRRRIDNWIFPAQYVKQLFDDVDTQKLVIRKMQKDMISLCILQNLNQHGFLNKQHWSKSKDGNGATMFPYLLFMRLVAISLERNTWQRNQEGEIKWQAAIALTNLNYRNIPICGGVAGTTWEAALKVLIDLGFILPMDKFSGPLVTITITLPPFKPYLAQSGSAEVVDLTTAMLEELAE